MSEDNTARALSEAANQSLRFADLERKYIELEKDRNTWLDKAKTEQTRASSLEEETLNLQQKIVELRSELSSANAKLLEEKEKGSQISLQSRNDKERASRLEAENDDLREEISEVTESKRELRNQLLELETTAKLNDSAAVPLHYEVDRLKKEIDSLSSHNKWLEEDMSNRGQELFKSKTQHSEQVISLREELNRAVSKRDQLTADVRSLESQKIDLDKKVESLSQTLKDVRDEAADVAESTDLELQAERKVAYLQKQQLDSILFKNDRLERDLENLRNIANKSANEIESEIDAVRAEIQSEADKVLEDQLASSKKEIRRLQMQLQDSIKRNSEGTSSPSTARLALMSGGTSMGLTDVYAKLNQTEDELNKEKSERQKLVLYIKQVEADISAKTPILQRQKKEYEEALQRQEEMQIRLRDSLNEAKNCRDETQEVRDELNRIQKKNEHIRGENVDLAKQIQALLTSKAGGDISEGVPTTIAEMQKQNQHLLGEHRRLAGRVSELQDQIQNDRKTMRLEKLSQELETLREERSRQENAVASIVQQRDLYRALLSKHEGSSDEIANTELLVNSKAARLAESRCHSLEDDLAKARADLVAAEGDRQALLERGERYTMLNNELQLTVEKLQNELSISNTNGARREAEAAFYTEKSSSSTKSLDKIREELKKVLESKDEFQKLNAKLQQQIVERNTEISKYEHDLRQAEMKLRLSATQIETAKTAESRLGNETSQLRLELTRQGAMLESLQRIEATLTAKNMEEKEVLKEEISRLKELLELERSKQSLDSEGTQSRVKELELERKDAVGSKEKALADLVAAKDDLISANAARQKLETNLAALQAELSSLKQRSSTNVHKKDASEHLKSEALTQELKDAKAEAIAAKERVTNFEKIAKATDDELAKLVRASEDFKKGKEAEIKELRNKIKELKDESKKKDEVISEFTKDLSSQRDEQKQGESVLQQRLSGLEDQLNNAKKEAEAAEALSGKISSEMEGYKNAAAKSRNDYERELDLHANARSELRTVRDQLTAEQQLRVTAEEKMDIATTEISEKEKQLNHEKEKMILSLKEMTESLELTRKQNDVLHCQIQTLSDQLEKVQSDRIDKSTESPDSAEENADRMQVSELREIVKFMRSEREMSEAHLDAARRTAEREKAASVVMKRSLDEARAEIKILQASMKSKDDGDLSSNLESKLKVAEEQLLLLKESNKLLRVESEKLQLSVTELKADLSNEKKSVEPIVKKEKELLVEKAGLEAERSSLQRELESWKNRVQSLVSKFNQVDPEEHQRIVKEAENVRKECSVLKTQKDASEKEGASAKALVAKLNKDLSSQKTILQKQQAMLKKMNLEKESAAKTSSTTASVTKERDQLKEMYKKMKSEFTSKETELKGANDRIENLKQRLRLFQKTISDQRQKISSLETTLSATAVSTSIAQNLTSNNATKGAEATQTGDGANSKVVKLAETKEEGKAKSTAICQENPKANTKESVKEDLPSVPESGFRFGPSSKQTPVAPSTPNETSSTEIDASNKKDDSTKEEVPSKQEPLSRKQKILAKTGDTTKKDHQAKKDLPANDEPPVKKQKVLDKEESTKKEAVKKQEELAKKKAQEKDASIKKEVSDASKNGGEEKEEKLKAAKEKLQQLRKRKAEMKSAQENAKKKGAICEGQQTEEAKNDNKSTVESLDVKAEQDNSKESTDQSETTAESRTSKEEKQADETPKSQAFGGSTPFGSGVTFGSGATTFGKSTFGNQTSGSGAVFGSSSSIGGFGSISQPATGVNKATAASSSVFLDMKPPSSTAAPFSFGSSSIKLPTPTLPSSTPAASPFGAFSGKAFGGGATPTAKPLFGSSAGIKDSAPESKEESTEDKPAGDGSIEDKDSQEEDTS
mmetsp:Transcript_18894/g.27951  ORF Transcript_18894/g.27951 Transcript_18894/m.27951 type:complete len:1878 (-) Transcript_18894:926-6559(-)|eukprot:CAMPEP_0194224480 /NCGR_PEP_ID=MMETSP0156-20130528/37572_1 /TAXON_ID=33649 /ORGANISM="Thalassionema nitzschioides, Strain L26-B" /LENGTH=1877 /DNA_ID=CAMNT_0038956063 /DNA_START=94 /DNA_END=5727 /DNA_ORIENTATION=-